MGMKICFFGQFDPQNPRNLVFSVGWKQLGHEIVYCQTGPNPLIITFLKLLVKQSRLEFDVLFVPYGFFSVYSLILAKIVGLVRRKTVIFDAFISLHEVYVQEREMVSLGGLRAKLYWWLDWLSIRLADRVTCDTFQNIDYFVRQYRGNKDKFCRIIVGTDRRLFRPISVTKTANLRIGWWGSFLKLHGLEYIIEAASLLKCLPVQFKLYGKGLEHRRIRTMAKQRKLTKVKFYPNAKIYRQPLKYLNEMDLVLGGPFGKSPRVERVVPIKVIESLAAGKPTIVGNTGANREFFPSNVVWFCSPQSGAVLAKVIKQIYRHKEQLTKRGELGYRWFLGHATQEKINQELSRVLVLETVRTQNDR